MEGIILITISSYSATAELWYLLISEVQDILVFTGEIPHSNYRVFQQYLPFADVGIIKFLASFYRTSRN